MTNNPNYKFRTPHSEFHIYKYSRGSVITPRRADAATVKGDARYTWDCLDPIRPGKFLFVVDRQTSFPSVLPKVSGGPPRQAAHDGPPAIFAPAFSSMEYMLSPSINSSFSRFSTSVVAGTTNVSTFTLCPRRIFAAALKSSTLPPVHEPMYHLSILVPFT